MHARSYSAHGDIDDNGGDSNKRHDLLHRCMQQEFDLDPTGSIDEANIGIHPIEVPSTNELFNFDRHSVRLDRLDIYTLCSE